MRGGGGQNQIVQVHRGHIVRSTGRKDRHSKVYTAKGPRDRRVRLSPHTAIQFYDVQDRLGFDRPSKAVDWLIQNAKPAIDKLAHFPTPLRYPDSATIPADDIDDDDDNDNGAASAGDSGEMKNEASGFMPQPPLGSVTNSIIDTTSRKDLLLSLRSSFHPQHQEQHIALFAGSEGPEGLRFENGGESFRDEFSYFDHLTPSAAIGGYDFPQRGTLQSSFSTSLSFPGRFGFEGVHEVESDTNFL